jgi:hypothetical protein
MMIYKGGKREEGRGKREEGRGNRTRCAAFFAAPPLE